MKTLLFSLLVLTTTTNTNTISAKASIIDIDIDNPNYIPPPTRHSNGPVVVEDPFGPNPLHPSTPDFDVVDPVDFFGLDLILKDKNDKKDGKKKLDDEPFPLPHDNEDYIEIDTDAGSGSIHLLDKENETSSSSHYKTNMDLFKEYHNDVKPTETELHHEIFGHPKGLFDNELMEGDVDYDYEEEETNIQLDPNLHNLLIHEEDDNINNPTNSRKLSSYSSTIGTFQRLECTPASYTDCHTNTVSSLVSLNSNSELKIPCNKCYTFDISGNITINGLNIEGKLIFPLNHKVSIRTPYVIVQGELEINVDHVEIKPDNISTKFILTGNQNVIYTPTEAPNHNVCPNGGCNFGSKPFVIVGGKVNINGMPDTCDTHTPVLKKIRKDPIYDPNDFPKFTLLPPSCPLSTLSSSSSSSFGIESGRKYASYDFESSYGNFTGKAGAFVVLDDGVMKITNRKLDSRGPFIDLTPSFPSSCLVPDQEYLFYAR